MALSFTPAAATATLHYWSVQWDGTNTADVAAFYPAYSVSVSADGNYLLVLSNYWAAPQLVMKKGQYLVVFRPNDPTNTTAPTVGNDGSLAAVTLDHPTDFAPSLVDYQNTITTA